MNKLFWFGLFMLLLAPSRAKAQSPFDGLWLRDLTRAQLPTKPTTSLLQNGVLHCEICRPPLDVKVDGQDHLIPSADACRNIALVEVLDDRTVEVSYMENGRVTGTTKVMVSPNRATLTLQDVNACDTKGKPQSSTLEETRVASGQQRSHAISGSWQITKASGQEYAMAERLYIKDDTLTRTCMRMPMGLPCYPFTAKLDGTYTSVAGAPDHSLVAVKRENANTLLETWKREGKVIEIDRMTVDPAGQLMIILSADPQRGTTERVMAKKFKLTL